MSEIVIKETYKVDLRQKLRETPTGPVFKCENIKNPEEELVAKKIIFTESMDAATKHSLFQQASTEIKMANHFSNAKSNPHILKLVDSHHVKWGEGEGEEKAVIYLITEGGTTSMDEQLQDLGPQPEGDTIEIIKLLLQGISQMHEEAKVAHRHIKSVNIEIPRSGAPKLANFGLSTIVAEEKEEKRENIADSVGAPNWLAPECVAPEQFADHDFIDPRSADIWALGCVVVECLSGGKPPFHDMDSAASVRQEIASGASSPIPKDVSHKKKRTKCCMEFLELCFQRDPKDRPSAAVLLKHPWMHFCDGDPTPWREENSDEDDE